MSVTQSVTRRRRLAVAACTALLTSAGAVGCSDLGRTAVGPADHLTGRGRVVQVNSPVIKGCHMFAPPGAVEVSNGTLVDMKLYRTLNCSGKASTYIATELSDTISPELGPWRSYRFVH